jgi:hypothetical protein
MSVDQTFQDGATEAVGNAPEPTAVNTASAVVVETVAPTTNSPEFEVFTAEDLARVREQEKSKVYPQLERMKEEISALKREKEQREVEEARRKAEEEMEVRDLLSKKEQEFTAQLEAERLERERAFALLETEKRFQELQSYRQQRVEQERDAIIPELLDLVDGSSLEEIDASINSLRERSERILESAQQAMQSARRDMAGSRVTAPAAGPLDTDPDNRMYTPDDIRGMSMADYMKNRQRLLGDSASSRGRGLFG